MEDSLINGHGHGQLIVEQQSLQAIPPLTLFEPPVGAAAAAADTFRLFWIWIELLGPGKSLSSNLGSGSDISLQIS